MRHTAFSGRGRIVAEKLCPECRQSKSYTEYHSNRSKPDGLATYCKSCSADYSRRRRVVATAGSITCAVEDCPRGVTSRGYCYSHYGKWRKFGDPLGGGTARPKGYYARRDEQGRKRCKDCTEWLPTAEFGVDALMVDGLCVRCKQCSSKMRHRYSWGLDRDYMAAAQDNKCAVCAEGLVLSGQNYAVDHDHSCCPETFSCGACRRSILCFNCNTALGMVKDNVSLLRNLADYIEHWADNRRQLRSA